jgi:hypothetical protein
MAAGGSAIPAALRMIVMRFSWRIGPPLGGIILQPEYLLILHLCCHVLLCTGFLIGCLLTSVCSRRELSLFVLVWRPVAPQPPLARRGVPFSLLWPDKEFTSQPALARRGVFGFLLCSVRQPAWDIGLSLLRDVCLISGLVFLAAFYFLAMIFGKPIYKPFVLCIK